MVVQATDYSGSHLVAAAPSVLPSLEDIEAEVMGNMLVTLHHSAVREESHLAAAGIEPGITG